MALFDASRPADSVDCRMSPKRTRIALFCPSLGLGGSEQQLVNLAIGLQGRGYDVRVLVLSGGEPLEQPLQRHCIPVISLNRKAAFGAVAAAVRLRRYIRREQVNFLYSFHGLPNLLAAMARLFARHVKIILGVRATRLDVSQRAWWRRWAYWLEPRLAAFAHLVIANSHAGYRDAVQRGFPAVKLRVVVNGIDFIRFAPDSELGLQARRELHLGASRVVGLVARIDPMKGHRIFLEAAALVRAQQAAIRFLCVWDGDLQEQRRLAELARRLGLSEAVLWTRGDREMRGLYNAMDIVVSSSCYGEGFSNSIAEAMACGCRCVVTDVGDSAKLVEGIGIVVPPGDSAKLADGVLRVLTAMHDENRSVAARERILSRYSPEMMVNATLECLAQLTGDGLVSQQIDDVA